MTKMLNQNPLLDAALEFQNTLQKKGWKFCYIGGLAVLRWGDLRMTQDVDVCLLCGFGSEEKYIPGILEIFESRILKPEDFALKNRVLLLKASNGIPIDISLSGLTFEEEMINRATLFEFTPDYSLLTCSAEDLIVLKAFADRPKDWMDIEGILVRQGNKLNRTQIIKHLLPLCEAKQSNSIIQKLEKMFKTFG